MGRGRFIKPKVKIAPSDRIISGVCQERQVLDHSITARNKVSVIRKEQPIYILEELYTTEVFSIGGSEIYLSSENGEPDLLLFQNEDGTTYQVYEEGSEIFDSEPIEFLMMNKNGEPEEVLVKKLIE